MSREILFKAKRIGNSEWIEGSLLVLDDGSCRIATSCLVGDVENVLTVCAYDVDPGTVCRYIGLTDKNGNKIWENDVVKKHFYTDYDAYANSEEYNNGWIPCSERLPQLYENTSDVVLVCGNNDYQHMAFWCSDGKWRYCQSGMIKEPMDWIEIVAWQPLPEPYKEGGEVNE